MPAAKLTLKNCLNTTYKKSTVAIVRMLAFEIRFIPHAFSLLHTTIFKTTVISATYIKEIRASNVAEANIAGNTPVLPKLIKFLVIVLIIKYANTVITVVTKPPIMAFFLSLFSSIVV